MLFLNGIFHAQVSRNNRNRKSENQNNRVYNCEISILSQIAIRNLLDNYQLENSCHVSDREHPERTCELLNFSGAREL